MGKGMRAGKKKKVSSSFGGGGGNQMKKLEEMQKKVAEAGAEADKEEFDVSVGGGAIKMKMNGKKEVLSLDIEDSLITEGDKEMLSDLLLSAFNEGVKKAEEITEEKMNEVTGGWTGTF